MQIYDMVVAAVVAAFVFRGWARGLLREAVELAVLVVGVFLVFRLSPVVGSIIAGMANVPYEVARIAAGAALLFALVLGGALVARLVSAAMKVLPGATILNRIGGSLLGAGYGLLIVVLATTLVSVAPIPEGASATVESAVAESPVGQYIVDPVGPVQQAVASVSGERIFSTVLALREAVGGRLAAGTIPVPLPDVGDAPLAPSQQAAQGVFDTLNRTRIGEGLDPFAWSADLAVVAVARSTDVYRSGWLALDDGLSASLAAQGVPGTITTEMVVLAASPAGLVEALMAASSYKDAICCERRFRKAGIGVIDGPHGLLAVVVLSG